MAHKGVVIIEPEVIQRAGPWRAFGLGEEKFKRLGCRRTRGKVIGQPVQAGPCHGGEVRAALERDVREMTRKRLGSGAKIIRRFGGFDAVLPETKQIEEHVFRPIDIAAKGVHRDHRLEPSTRLIQIVNRIVGSHMRGQHAVVGAQANGDSCLRPTRKMAVQIGVQNEHVWLVECDIPPHRRLAEVVAESLVEALDRKLNEFLKSPRRSVVQPGIHSQPGRVSEMLQRDHRLHARFATGSNTVRIGIHCRSVEGRRWTRRVRERRLHARPLDAQAKRIEPHSPGQFKVAAIPIPEIHRAPGAIHPARLLAGAPIVLRLAGPVVSAFALISRSGDPD